MTLKQPEFQPPPQETVTIVESYIEKPIIVDTVITPTYKPLQSSKTRFPYGYCTYYVSTKVNVPWSGNAGTWVLHARSDGYKIGNNPVPNSILITSEGRVGHAAYVEKVNTDNTFTVSEMNYEGFGKVSYRTIPNDYKAIKGFIYTN